MDLDERDDGFEKNKKKRVQAAGTSLIGCGLNRSRVLYQSKTKKCCEGWICARGMKGLKQLHGSELRQTKQRIQAVATIMISC